MTTIEGEAGAMLARRVREIRRGCCGQCGVLPMAEGLGLPARTRADDEAGVIMPAEVLLRFIEVTAANPRWLATGEGPRYATARATLA